MPSYHLSILTAEGPAFEGEVTSLVAPGHEGYVGIMAGHTPFICALRPGVLTVRTEDAVRYYAVGEGVLEVSGDDASILADAVDDAANNDEAKKKAQAWA